MGDTNGQQDTAAGGETPAEPSGACCPGCACRETGRARLRAVVGITVLIAAAALGVRAIVRDRGQVCGPATCTFPSVGSIGQTAPVAGLADVAPGKDRLPADKSPMSELGAFGDLNTVAADTDAVFVLLPGKDGPPGDELVARINGAAETIRSKGIRLGLFMLKADSADYGRIAEQVAVPGVLAMARGRGSNVVTGDVTEAKLIQAFVGASSVGGCGPSGCGPTGCE